MRAFCLSGMVGLLSLFGSVALAPADGPLREDLSRNGKLPRLTQPVAKHHARTATRGKFGSGFDYANGKKVGCGDRLSRVRIRCKVKFGLGDTGYKGHVAVYYRWKNGDVWWFTKGKFKVTDYYCLNQGGSRHHCTDTKGWG